MYTPDDLRRRPLQKPELLPQYEWWFARTRATDNDCWLVERRFPSGSTWRSLVSRVSEVSRVASLALARHIVYGDDNDLAVAMEMDALAHELLDLAVLPFEELSVTFNDTIQRDVRGRVMAVWSHITSRRWWGEQTDWNDEDDGG